MRWGGLRPWRIRNVQADLPFGSVSLPASFLYFGSKPRASRLRQLSSETAKADYKWRCTQEVHLMQEGEKTSSGWNQRLCVSSGTTSGYWNKLESLSIEERRFLQLRLAGALVQ